MFACSERAAEGGKLSRERTSQPLGSVMTGKRKLKGKRSECSEVKDVCPESEPQPRERRDIGCGPIPSSRAQAMQEAR